MEPKRLELLTSCLQSICAANCATTPKFLESVYQINLYGLMLSFFAAMGIEPTFLSKLVGLEGLEPPTSRM